MPSERICSECVHAALDSGGVYCKLFGEQIFNERTAEECGEFEAETWLPPAAEHAALVLVPNGWVPPERDRTLSVQVDVEYFGKEENGDTIVKNLGRLMALHLGDKVKVRRL
jgi:hypothetical protein